MESGSRPAPEISLVRGSCSRRRQWEFERTFCCIFPSFLVEAMIHAGAEEHYPLSLKYSGVSLRD